MSLRLTKTQRLCIERLRQKLDAGHRAALLQLPTGQGKSHVAVEVYKKWGRPRGLNLLVVTPADKERSKGWRMALDLLDGAPAGRPFHVDRSSGRPANACRVTLQQLTRFFKRGARPTEEWQRWLVQHKAFVVVDEFHRSKSWRRQLASAFEWESSQHLASWFRPGLGPRPSAPVWLLLSATPYNPVALDFQLDLASSNVEPEADVKREVRALGREVKATLYALAALDDQRDWQVRASVKDLVEGIETALAAPKESERISLGRGPLVIVPGATHHLRPRRSYSPIGVDTPKSTPEDLRLVAELYRRLFRGMKRTPGVVTLAERLILAGVRPTDHKRKLEGHSYGRTTVAAVVRGMLPSAAPLAGLEALVTVVQAALDEGDKVLVFCSHRAAATAARRFLNNKLRGVERKSVAEASSDGGDAKAFDEDEDPRVLVTTDVNSESVDLHSRCRTLVHFELPWTPLRVIQRYGRLWRLMPGGRQGTPRVFHVAHPGSVAEEILNRLDRRWSYLKVLGIDYVDFNTALGTRVPQVPWKLQWEEKGGGEGLAP